MASSTEQLFLAVLRSEHIKDALLPHLSTTDLCNIRQSSSACCNLLTKRLFTRIHVSFSASTFTKSARVAALARIGHHVEHLTFYFPHSDATFLPPLVHPVSGNEICFLYTPHTSMGSVLSRPKYANAELGDILTQQYPPLFHAATNVPSFINAMRNFTNMRHLTIRCPGQDPRERYRRDTVDYALISLRISLERAPLEKLHKLSLSQLHPAAFNYLRHVNGFGTVPSAGRRWRQINRLSISVDAWDFYGTAPGRDHLKIMDEYIRNLAPNLDKFAFTWLGRKGPCPVALAADPLFAPPRASRKLFHEVTSPMSPLPETPGKGAIYFPKLRYLQVRNAVMNAPQLSHLINSHRPTVKEFDFESVVLSDNGNWDDVLAPIDTDDAWSRSNSMAAPSEYSLVTSPSSEHLPSPSAAVTAASRELLDMDLGGFPFDDIANEVIDSFPTEEITINDETLAPMYESDAGFSTKLRKKRSRRRRRKHRSNDDDAPETPSPSPKSSLRSLSRRHKPSRPRLQTSVEEESLRPRTPIPNISAPRLISDPQPVLLQPTTYDPTRRKSTSRDPNEGISPVQRNIEQEETHRLLAEDAAARVSALQKAKAAVLSKLSREFCNSKKPRVGDANACRFLAGRDLGTAFGPGMVMEDRRALESRSVLVPLMFSRA
ncbi:Ff.00g071020.m01.CDS01 [Fusarium sp. VM40]|nr:Ff.00g071020.m01.CDS01 [Fusarium sp. VM40]